MKVYQQ